MKKRIIFFGLIVSSLVACTKEGPQGPAGANGNANVVSATITSSAWVFNDPSWVIAFSYPAITQDIIDKGAVLVYIRTGSEYRQLPFTFYEDDTYSSSFEVSTYLGGVKIIRTDSDLIEPENPGNLTFKVVVISASGLSQNPNIDFKDYNAVKQAFKLNDKDSYHFVK
ncbi:MAG: hypothetical protein RL264_2672 [Bacteroidota bacterium]|jgi:hypothetical protein